MDILKKNSLESKVNAIAETLVEYLPFMRLDEIEYSIPSDVHVIKIDHKTKYAMSISSEHLMENRTDLHAHQIERVGRSVMRRMISEGLDFLTTKEDGARYIQDRSIPEGHIYVNPKTFAKMINSKEIIPK